MKNNFIFLLLLIIFIQPTLADELKIEASNISIDKKTKTTIFNGNVIASDPKNNVFKADFAEYKKDLQLLKSKGKTTILTSEGFLLTGTNITFDNTNNLIQSSDPAVINDLENNNIYLDAFEYSTNNNLFKSAGNIKVVDSNDNSYNFSQIYIDEKKREIIGTDVKAFLNQSNFKVNDKNKPRVFSNTVKINEKQSEFGKSVFTLCNYRKNDKCPPWSLQASKMTHDKKSKTIFYDNAVIKIYDLPIFYMPKLSHPDPSVDRRTGFLPVSLSDTKNLGPGIELPYYWAFNKNKDFTLSSNLFSQEHPLFIGEYRHAFKNANLIVDAGYTEGYKNTTAIKRAGNKSHFFSKFVKNFKSKDNSDNNFEASIQRISHDKYLKLYKINTNLVEYEKDTLENSLSFVHENEDLYLGVKASAFETLKEGYNDKYEYILPEVVFDKNLFSSNKYGSADLTSNVKVHNYDTNAFTKFFVNDVDWKYKDNNFSNGIKGRLLGKLKNVNYETKNATKYKANTTNELFGALGYLTEVDFYKKGNSGADHLLTPKMLLRYAPGHMREETSKTRLNHLNIFNLDRLNAYDNFENGLSTTLGFNYKVKNLVNEFNFSLGQVINERENKNMPSTSSLDQRFSDVVGYSNFEVNKKIKLNYNFALDQNLKSLNYNEVGASLDFNPVKFDFNYLQEQEHIGNQEYVKAKVAFSNNTNGLVTAETKRNLITNSAEFYNLSYEYLNDCLKAGLVYRREFYNDSEIEAENSLMFKITLTPFGDVRSPSFNR